MLWTYEDELKLGCSTAYQKGKLEGEERGITIGEKRKEKEIASNLLKIGVSPELIAQATKLSEQQIRNYVSS